MTSETIAAIATPPGMGGVGIVRVSGPLAASLASAISGGVPPARMARHAVFRDAQDHFIDSGLVLFFSAPASFTGEDVLELQGHGGPVVMDLLLQRCLELGARHARPGEFTERAFLNGKLDLTQAEAVADLIESSSALAARLAGQSLQGVFSNRVKDVSERLIALRTYIEATLDFAEEELDSPLGSAVSEDLFQIIDLVQELMGSAHQGCVIREGLHVVIAGAPNAGKSSLLNALSRSDAAIVTSIPGTTRDLLKVDIQIDGLPVRLVDTAGLRTSHDPVESEGIRRAREQIERADLILWIEDASLDGAASERLDLGSGALHPDAPVTRIRNKIDLIGEAPSDALVDNLPVLSLSAATGAGLDHLRAHLKARAGIQLNPEGAFTARRRHLDALRRALNALEDARHSLINGSSDDLIAEDLYLAQRALGEITGEFSSDDLLGRIFSSFCIGK